jgi:hypothetical protein
MGYGVVPVHKRNEASAVTEGISRRKAMAGKMADKTDGSAIRPLVRVQPGTG